MEGRVTQEASAWLRAHDVAGAPLTEDIIETRANIASVDEQINGLGERPAVTGAANLMAAGDTLDEAAKKADRLASKAARWDEADVVARQARGVARGRLSRLVAEQRDTLIVGIRPVIDALIAEARPHAEALADFAPDYAPAAIVRKATPEQLKAWQAADELERKFGTLMAAWRVSFKATNAQGGIKSPSRVPGFDLRWVGQEYRYWERHELVQKARLNGTFLGRRGYPVAIEPTVLGVACEPKEAGFRLCTVRELKDAYDAERLAKIEEARAVVRQRRSGRGMAV